MKARREFLAALAAAPVLATAMRSQGASAQAPLFAPPKTPMRLTRTLVRHLFDGKQIVVERSWRIRFVALGRGFRVEGEQVDVNVAAPAGLEALARMEQSRSDEAMFPLTLDTHGAIVGIAAGREDELVDRAIERARQRIAVSDETEADKRAGQRFLASLLQFSQSVLSHWPRSLFSPDREQAVIRRAIELPGEPPGEIEIRIDAARSGDTGLLLWLERQIETRAGGSSRLSEERFRLAEEPEP